MNKPKTRYFVDQFRAFMFVFIGLVFFMVSLTLDIRFIPFWGSIILGSIWFLAGVNMFNKIQKPKESGIDDLKDIETE